MGESVREPLLYYDANVASTLVLLEEMERFGSAGAHACDDDNDDNDGAKVGGGGGGGGDGGGGNDGVGSDDNAVGSSSSGGSDNESGVRSGGVKGRVRKKLIFSSSATVYGSSSSEKEAVPITEDSPTGGAGITNPYGRTKHVIEEMLGDLTRRPPSTPTATAAAAGTENKCNNKKGGDGDVEEEEEAWDVVVLRYFNPVGCYSIELNPQVQMAELYYFFSFFFSIDCAYVLLLFLFLPKRLELTPQASSAKTLQAPQTT